MIDIEVKFCPGCGIDKSVSEFSRDFQKKNGLCSRCKDCAKKYREASSRRRALKRGNGADFYSRQEIFSRDLWICRICFIQVDHELKYPDLHSASIDHVIPISKGASGPPFNVQLAHLGCNLSKKDSIRGDLN